MKPLERPLRWVPDLPFPRYRHRLGETPHPRTHPLGHSFGVPDPHGLPLTQDNWRQHEAWLFGVDLFNHGYWWEAHEWWEAAWRVSQQQSTRHLLQGLIQTAAALLKWEEGNHRGREGLWSRAEDHLRHVGTGGTRCMGLQVTSFIQQMGRLWAAHATAPPTAADSVLPRLQLTDVDATPEA